MASWLPPSFQEGSLGVLMNTVAPSQTGPRFRFEPWLLKFRVRQQHPRQPQELILDKSDRFHDDVVVEFPEHNPRARFYVEEVKQLQDATVLVVPQLQRLLLHIPSGTLGQVCATAEELRKQLLEHIGQSLMELAVEHRKLANQHQIEAEFQYIADEVLAMAQHEGFQEFERAKLRVNTNWTLPYKFVIQIIADFPAFGGQAAQRLGWNGDLGIPSLPHYDPRVGGAPIDYLKLDDLPEPAPKPSPFVDHKPYWKLPP
jgi:hypothetical protein